MTRAERQDIAKARLVKILKTYKAAAARTLEQKISDAGPNPMRVDPHILTSHVANWNRTSRILRINRDNSTWYALTSTPEAEVEAKLQTLIPIHSQLCDQSFNMRLGQALEIAIFRAPVQLQCPSVPWRFSRSRRSRRLLQL